MRVLLSERYPRLRKLNGFFLRRIAGSVVLGERHTSIFKGLMDPARVHIVENFAPDELFVSDEVLERKFVEKEKVRVLYLSNLLPGKGYKDLVTAIGSLSSEVRSQLLFDFAGGFESESAEEEFMESIRNFTGVKYHGSVQGRAKASLLEQADVFCLPTYYPFEGQPISILEAYANGCTVLTTDHSGIFDIFTPEVNGVAVEKKSPASIAKALEQLVRDRGLLRRYGSANVRLARDKFKPHQHLARLKERLSIVAV
jgi:glycosyltransferase involved in cell wall biosynthesis